MLIKGQISYILSRPAIPNFIPFFMKTFWNSGCFLFCFFGFFLWGGGCYYWTLNRLWFLKLVLHVRIRKGNKNLNGAFSFCLSILLLRFKLHRAFPIMPWMHRPNIDIQDASYAVARITTTSLISLQQLLIADSNTFPYHFTIFFSDRIFIRKIPSFFSCSTSSRRGVKGFL